MVVLFILLLMSPVCPFFPEFAIRYSEPGESGEVTVLAPPAGQPSKEQWEGLKRAADLLEIWRYDGSWGKDLNSELVFCWEHAWRLRDCPGYRHRLRWPDRATTEAITTQLNGRYELLQARRWGSSHWESDADWLLLDCIWRRGIWQLAYEAQSSTPCTARYALQELRERLGDEAYFAGRLPSWLPE